MEWWMQGFEAKVSAMLESEQIVVFIGNFCGSEGTPSQG
jgi:hypothetical protein